MRRGLMVGLCVAVSGFVGGAWAEPLASHPAAPAPSGPARPDLPLDHVITDPDWLQKPDGDDVSHYFPYFARIFHISGRATLHCHVTKAGDLAGCGIIGESPAGVGFGDAALGMSSHFRMRPRMLDGEPVDGGVVAIPIHFQDPDERANAPGASRAAAPSPIASPNALALGRRLAAATLREPDIAARITAYVERVRESRLASGQSPEQMKSLDAFGQTRDALRRQRIEEIAGVYATAMPEPMLAQAVAFMESPAGARWAAVLSQARGDEIAAMDALLVKHEIDDLAHLCQEITCPAVDTPPPRAAGRP